MIPKKGDQSDSRTGSTDHVRESLKPVVACDVEQSRAGNSYHCHAGIPRHNPCAAIDWRLLFLKVRKRDRSTLKKSIGKGLAGYVDNPSLVHELASFDRIHGAKDNRAADGRDVLSVAEGMNVQLFELLCFREWRIGDLLRCRKSGEQEEGQQREFHRSFLSDLRNTASTSKLRFYFDWNERPIAEVDEKQRGQGNADVNTGLLVPLIPCVMRSDLSFISQRFLQAIRAEKSAVRLGWDDIRVKREHSGEGL